MKRSRKAGVRLMAVAMAVALLSACSLTGGKGKDGLTGMDREDEGTLKVAYFNEQAFYTQYGNAFQAMFPNVTLEVVSTESVFNADDQVAEMERLFEEQKPDVVLLDEAQYASMAKKGWLYDLDPVIKQDEFDTTGFLPSVLELLKTHGGGKLYGLSPDFTSQALYYNKNLFDKHGIPYPTDGMSWEEVLQLAARFPVKKDGEDSLNGLFQSSGTTDAFELIRTIGEAKGLSFADADAGTVTIDMPEWKEIFQAVTDGYKSGSVSMPSDNGGNGGGAMMRGVGGRVTISIGPGSMNFMTGQAAMTIDGPMVMNLLGLGGKGGPVRMQQAKPGDGAAPAKSPFQEFEWDVVSLPVDPSQPDVTGSMHLENVFSVNAASESLPAAWEFVKYANGEQLAKTGAKSSPSLSSRTAYKKEADGKNIDAFYALGANPQSLLQTWPGDFVSKFSDAASNHVKKVVDGTETVDDALKAIQSEGQDLLTQAKLDAEAS